MFGQLRLMPASVDDPVPLVPIGAIQRVDGHDAVFVPGDKEGLYYARRVQTGAESDGLVEIREGLKLDDELVTDGAYDLKIALRSK
jgi:cobalt-zinc-cadmium efflux system membrane fusion protein